MKIGILTYHRSHNYGALLQAIALRYVLTEKGHDVSFVDYWPAYHKRFYSLFSFHEMKQKGFKGGLLYLKKCVLDYSFRHERFATFQSFIHQYIEPYLSSCSDSYDMIIHGSDQIWRKQIGTKMYNPIYFGNHNIKCSKRVSYAASMGVLPTKESDIQLLKSYFACLDAISVRETDLKILVQNCGYTCEQHLDPTLLLSKEQWCSIFNINQKKTGDYVLYYDLLEDSFDMTEIQRFASAHHLTLKTIFGRQSSGKNTDDKFYVANPKTLLDLIYHASFVFTSSFHGLVFALIFHKPFYASFSTNSGRAESILDVLKLKNYLIAPKSSIDQNYPIIDYQQVDEFLDVLRQKSLHYLETFMIDK